MMYSTRAGRQVMAIPIQTSQGGLTPILKAANIKMEGGGTQIIQPRPTGSQVMVGNSPVMVSLYYDIMKFVSQQNVLIDYNFVYFSK